MAKSKPTTRGAASKKLAAVRHGDEVQSLYRKFKEQDRLWRARERAYKSAMEAARAQYSKPTGNLEQILLLNQGFFKGEIHAPIPAHEKLLIEQCNAESQDKGVFERNYDRLKQWRAWRNECQGIGQKHRLAEFESEAKAAKERRDNALGAFIDAPARSAEGILLKLKYLEDTMYKDDAWHRYRLLGSAIKDLKAGSGAPTTA